MQDHCSTIYSNYNITATESSSSKRGERDEEAEERADQALGAHLPSQPAQTKVRLGTLLQQRNAAILDNRVTNFTQSEVGGIE